ncbi:hypothetical protein BDW62DRAFT_217368 [Aspergillus aurantiobrunneus]
MISPLTLIHHVFYAVGLINSAGIPGPRTPLHPLYAIAHRVLRPEAVTAALSHGANALEVDLTASNSDWWADHDGKANSAGTTARELFEFIASERRRGGNIGFVWLDIKNPDHCEEEEDGRCSIEGLRDMVRETLEPAGVRALYGFYQTEDSRGFEVMSESHNANEAIALSGEASEVLGMYSYTDIPARQRVMDYGYPQMEAGFGTCHELSYCTCSELRHGREAREKGQLGKVFGWTSTEGDLERVGALLGVARVDGIIYGFQGRDYADDLVVRRAFHEISYFVNTHTDSHRLATVDDVPW